MALRLRKICVNLENLWKAGIELTIPAVRRPGPAFIGAIQRLELSLIGVSSLFDPRPRFDLASLNSACPPRRRQRTQSGT
jgi:hypothetical protein